jgi:ribosomal protein S26
MLVRIGNISQGKIQCDGCKRTVPYAERYLIVNEKDGIEVEKDGETKRYCVKCALERGYGAYREEKGERILTFFKEEVKSPPKPPEQEKDNE